LQGVRHWCSDRVSQHAAGEAGSSLEIQYAIDINGDIFKLPTTHVAQVKIELLNQWKAGT